MTRSHKKIREKIEVVEKEYNPQFRIVFDALRGLLALPGSEPKPKDPIGFQP